MSANDTGERCDWTVTGMDCASCASKITTALSRLPGVEDVQVGVMSERLTLNLDVARTPRETVEATVKKLGFGIAPKGSPVDRKKAFVMPGAENVAGDDHAGHDHSPASAATAAATNSTAPKPNDTSDPGHGGPGHTHATDPKDRDKRWFQAAKGKLIIGTALLLAVAWAVKLFGSETLANYAFIAVCVIGVAPVAVRAFAALRAGIPFTVEALMTIAAIGALFSLGPPKKQHLWCFCSPWAKCWRV